MGRISSNIQRAGFGHVGIILAVMLFVGVLGTLAWVFFQNFTNQAGKSGDKQPNVTTITSFDECKQSAGSKILETYPQQCMTEDGKTFTRSPAYETITKDTTYCTPAEELCFDIPAGWKVAQVERGEGSASVKDTDMLTFQSPNGDLYLNLTTGIDGLGGTCGENEDPFTVVRSIPTKLSGFEASDYSTEIARVVQLVERNVNKSDILGNYSASMYLSFDKDLETVGEKTDTCKLMFATVLTGRNSRPYGDSEPNQHGSFTFIASKEPNATLLYGEAGPGFATKAEAEAIFDTDVYEQATAILTSVRYQE